MTIDEILSKALQWEFEIGVAEPLTRTFQEKQQMEVNGTILHEETTLDREPGEITKKSSIDDRSIAVRSCQECNESLDSMSSMQNEPCFGNPMTNHRCGQRAVSTNP